MTGKRALLEDTVCSRMEDTARWEGQEGKKWTGKTQWRAGGEEQEEQEEEEEEEEEVGGGG